MGYKVKGTIKQRKAIENMVKNNGNISKSMREAGYSIKTAINPVKLTGSKGFRLLCKEHGITEDLLVRSLVEDIRKKPGNRRAELELGAKMLGLFDRKN